MDPKGCTHFTHYLMIQILSTNWDEDLSFGSGRLSTWRGLQSITDQNRYSPARRGCHHSQGRKS